MSSPALILLPLNEVELLEDNPRDINQKEFEALCDDIKNDPNFLHQRPPLVNHITDSGKKVVYAGNQRLKAARHIGLEQIYFWVEENVSEEIQQKRKEAFQRKRVLKCQNCNNLFVSNKLCKSRQPKYCSKSCFGRFNRQIKKCNNCGQEYYHKRSYENKKYCSIHCAIKSRIGIKLSDEWKESLREGRKKSDKCRGQNLYNWKGGKDTIIARVNLSRQKRRTSTNIEIDINFTNQLLVAQNNRCFYCESDLSKYKAVEHLIPIIKGGDNQKTNLVYSCKKCNSSKGTLTLVQYSNKINKPDLIIKHNNLLSSLAIDKV